MGNSTRTLQNVVDSVSTIGDLAPVLTNTGGYANEPALTIANRAMADLIAERFNWKWNRLKINPFTLSSNQQDYASVSLAKLGWLETAAVVDVNNTTFPKPTYRLEVARELPIASVQGNPFQICWLPNSLLETGSWPGAGTLYVNPVGAVSTPQNPPTNILDANGNILVLTVFGLTGGTPPVAPAGSAGGVVVADGTAQWRVADPASAGFRVSPTPPGAGNVWLVRLFAQMSAVRFSSLGQTLDPLPDDFSNFFDEGFISYAHQYSADPAVRARFSERRAMWMQSLMEAARQGDREPESFGFFPDRPVASPGYALGLSAGWPFPGVRRF